MKVISLIETILKLEDDKWNLILKGAEVLPEFQMQIMLIDRRLDKLYAWYASAMVNGLVEKQTRISFKPGSYTKPERRKGRTVIA